MNTFYRWHLSSRQESLMQVSEKLFTEQQQWLLYVPVSSVMIYFGHVLNFKTVFERGGPAVPSGWEMCLHLWNAGTELDVTEGWRSRMPALLSHPVWAQGQGRVFPQNAQETPRIYPRDTLGFHLTVMSFLTFSHRINPGSQNIDDSAASFFLMLMQD